METGQENTNSQACFKGNDECVIVFPHWMCSGVTNVPLEIRSATQQVRISPELPALCVAELPNTTRICSRALQNFTQLK